MSTITELKHICIVGCGLIGGSFALALRRAGFRGRLTASDAERSIELAVTRGIIDAREECFDRHQPCEADLICLAAPISAIVAFLRTQGPLLRPGIMVTDVGSTKSVICHTASAFLPVGVEFVGGHPMAGSEHCGVEYARADLFDRATWALVPPATPTSSGPTHRLALLIEAIGARPLVVDAAAHDQAVALVSHLPQLLSSTLATLLTADSEANSASVDLARSLAASGWRDMTRLAASPFAIWRDIVMTNPQQISAALSSLELRLRTLQEAIEQRDYHVVRQLFIEANDSVEKLRSRRYRYFDQV